MFGSIRRAIPVRLPRRVHERDRFLLRTYWASTHEKVSALAVDREQRDFVPLQKFDGVAA